MALIKCDNCGKEISDKAKKCVHCGYIIKESKKERKCPNCNYTLTKKDNFCPNCGFTLKEKIDEVSSDFDKEEIEREIRLANNRFTSSAIIIGVILFIVSSVLSYFLLK